MHTHSERRIFTNVAANLAGNLLNRLIPLILVPVQLRILGEEAFGLLGFFAALTAIFAFVDLGLAITANREIARARVEIVKQSEGLNILDLVRTFETVYWIAGAVVGAIVLYGSEWFAKEWIVAPQLAPTTIHFSIAIMGLIFAVRWPISLYRGILQGLECQLELNLFCAIFSIISGIGSLLVLLIWSDIRSLFLWQFFAGIIEICGYIRLTWHSARHNTEQRQGRFRWHILKNVWRYALGVNIMTIIGVTLGQGDRLVISNIMTINNLGYFTVAVSVASLLGIVTGAIIPATTPRFVTYLSNGNINSVIKMYHSQTRLIAFTTTGIAYAIAAFSYQILLLWTQAPDFAEKAALTLSLVSLGAPLEAVSNTPNQVSLANGITSLSIRVRTLSGIIQLVGALLLVPLIGIEGAGFGWLLSRLAMYLAWPLILRHHLLKREQVGWLFRDTLPFFFVAALCYVGPHFLIRLTTNRLLWLLLIFGGVGLYALVTIMLQLINIDWRDLAQRLTRLRVRVIRLSI